MTGEGTFAITAWDAEPPYDAPADGPPQGRITVRKAFSGALSGTSEAHLLVCGEAGYVASERITGALDGRTGTFVVQHGATAAPDGSPYQFGNVVPGSGTGELAGLRGTITFAHERYAFDLELR